MSLAVVKRHNEVKCNRKTGILYGAFGEKDPYERPRHFSLQQKFKVEMVEALKSWVIFVRV